MGGRLRPASREMLAHDDSSFSALGARWSLCSVPPAQRRPDLSKSPAAIPGRSWCAQGGASAAGQERCQEGAISLRGRIAWGWDVTATGFLPCG